MTTKTPRVVVVTRPTGLQELLARHATRSLARFYLESRGRSFDDEAAVHERIVAAQNTVLRSVPRDFRLAQVTRGDLDRFLFEPEDLVITVGQDGLIANVAKYLDGQVVIGVNPLPDRYDGVLAQHSARVIDQLIEAGLAAGHEFEERAMVVARLDDGQELLALNEIFVGHRSHQSARYWLEVGKDGERQSSSGLIVTTGTGATGWARSINRERAERLDLPAPGDAAIAYFVREAFPSIGSGCALTEGLVTAPDHIEIVSELGEGGVIFGDGLEGDFLRFDWGQRVTIGVAERTLRLYPRDEDEPAPAVEPLAA